jgi:hypothetical protein
MAQPNNYNFLRNAFMYKQLGALYSTVFKKQSTFLTFVVLGAIVTEVATEGVTNKIWSSANKGVSLRSL